MDIGVWQPVCAQHFISPQRELVVGDEIVLRIVDAPKADSPKKHDSTE